MTLFAIRFIQRIANRMMQNDFWGAWGFVYVEEEILYSAFMF